MFIIKFTNGEKEWAEYVDHTNNTMLFKTKEEAEKEMKSFIAFCECAGISFDYKIVEVERVTKDKKIKVYLANGLFSMADREFNKKITEELRNIFPEVEFYLPQENLGINDKTKVVTSQDIARGDVKELRESDIVIAVLDGVEVDSGVATECGIAYALDKPVLGLITDIRFNNDNLEGKKELIGRDVFENPIMYRNLFLTGIIKESGGCICSSFEELVEAINCTYATGEENE